MNTEDVYLTGVHRAAFRAGEPAKIIGVKMSRPEFKSGRLCYEVRFEDGFIDLVPTSEVESGNYEVSTLRELLFNGIPEIIK